MIKSDKDTVVVLKGYSSDEIRAKVTQARDSYEGEPITLDIFKNPKEWEEGYLVTLFNWKDLIPEDIHIGIEFEIEKGWSATLKVIPMAKKG